jgi:putative membrane protein
MNIFSLVLTLFVAVQHVAFCVLEMFLWTKPAGLKIFGQTPEQAASSAVLAGNQGLYNLFLAVGLVLSAATNRHHGLLFVRFFLGCVIVAGVYGAATVKPKIFFVQAVPALVATAVTFL